MSESTEVQTTTTGGASRRRFLVGAGAGLAVTAAGVAVATDSSAAPADQAAPAQAEAVQAGAAATGVPMVVYITDNKHNRVSIQRGGREVVVQDGHLVQALNRAFDRRRATKEC